jgi:hypothetical protein
MPTRIRPGQFYLARFTKNELLVRIEEVAPQGGWIARSLSHGRKVMIKEESQIIHACDENGVELVADKTVPNRRSTALPPEPKPNIATLSNEPPVHNACPPVLQPISKAVYHAEPCSLLDATAMILREKHKPMSSREIVEAVVEQRLWIPSGKTPSLTLHTALSREIAKGSASRFRKADEKGKFTLRK